MIYLDHNATTFMHPEARAAMLEVMQYPYNASSIHGLGREAKYKVEQARAQIKKLVGIDRKDSKYQVIFTSSGTEANNLICLNFVDGEIFISSTEHASIYQQREYLPKVTTIKVQPSGIIDFDDLEIKLQQSTATKKLLSVMLANNETGVIQPLADIVKIARKYNIFIHSDCAQATGKINVDIEKLGIDFASLSAHKFGGPQGVGALVSLSKFSLKPMLIGGGQEKGARSSTENVAAIVGFGKIADIVSTEIEDRKYCLTKLQNYLENTLLSHNIDIIARAVPRLPNTTLILQRGIDAMTMLIKLDIAGIAVSSGSACSSGKVGNSYVLRAMGYSLDEANSAIRVSLSYDQKLEDIEKFLEIYLRILKKDLKAVA